MDVVPITFGFLSEIQHGYFSGTTERIFMKLPWNNYWWWGAKIQPSGISGRYQPVACTWTFVILGPWYTNLRYMKIGWLLSNIHTQGWTCCTISPCSALVSILTAFAKAIHVPLKSPSSKGHNSFKKGNNHYETQTWSVNPVLQSHIQTRAISVHPKINFTIVCILCISTFFHRIFQDSFSNQFT